MIRKVVHVWYQSASLKGAVKSLQNWQKLSSHCVKFFKKNFGGGFVLLILLPHVSKFAGRFHRFHFRGAFFWSLKLAMTANNNSGKDEFRLSWMKNRVLWQIKCWKQHTLTTKREAAATEKFTFELYTILCRFFVIVEKIDKTDLYTLLCRCFVIIGKIDKTHPHSLFAVNACKCSAVNNLQNYNFKSCWNVEQEVSCTRSL